MDKLARQLRQDAENIDVSVSAELETRITASLQGVQPEQPAPVRRPSKPASFWWASSLTGVAAAVAVIAVVNLQQTEPEVTATTSTPLVLPSIEWQAETAVFTSPLEQEFEDLQSDLKKAEEAVKQDIERLF